MISNERAYTIVTDLLYRRTGQIITPSRRWRIVTALGNILRELDLSLIEQLAERLESDPTGALGDRVAEALLNNETYFFRDVAYFDILAKQVLPELAAANAQTRTLSIWSAGCSTGQEALSLAMLLVEQGANWDGWTINILGTDISRKAIQTARRNRYTQFEIQRGISVGRMLNFFEETGSGWTAQRDLHAMVRFEQANLLEGPPADAAFDLVLCRNVLLYFDNETRERAFSVLRRGTCGSGILMLGAGETSVGHTDAFHPAPGLAGFYRPSEEVSAKAA